MVPKVREQFKEALETSVDDWFEAEGAEFVGEDIWEDETGDVLHEMLLSFGRWLVKGETAPIK